MERIIIALARVVSLLDVPAVDPRGQTSTSEGIKLLAARYSFLKIPQTLEEMDFQKGVDLSVGTMGGINIDKMTLFGNGIVVDTRSSTDDCDAVIKDLLGFVKESFGATVQSARRMVLSNITFSSNMQLARLHPILGNIADKVAASVSRDYGQSLIIEPSLVAIGIDLSQLKLQPSAFTVERRADTPFFANTYFSAAPIRTEDHLNLIQEFEAAIL